MMKMSMVFRAKFQIVVFAIEWLLAMILVPPLLLYWDICKYILRIQPIDYCKEPWEREGNDKKRRVMVLDVKCPDCGCQLKRTWWRSPDESWAVLMGTAGWITFCDNCKKTINYEQVIRN